MVRYSNLLNASASARVVSLALLVLTSAFGAANATQPDPSGVPTLTVGVREAGRFISADGHIEATHQALVASQVIGRVTVVLVDAGDRVADWPRRPERSLGNKRRLHR